MKKLVAVVMTMTDADRCVFIHCGLEGKTAADTAMIVCASEAAVRTRWSRRREKLADHPIWREFDPAES